MKMKRACQKHSNHFDWKLLFCSSNSEIIIYVVAYRIICSSYFLFYFFSHFVLFSVSNQPMYIFRANKQAHSNINVFNMTLHYVLCTQFTYRHLLQLFQIYISYSICSSLLFAIYSKSTHIPKHSKSQAHEFMNNNVIPNRINQMYISNYYLVVFFFFLFLVCTSRSFTSAKPKTNHSSLVTWCYLLDLLSLFSFGECTLCFYDYYFYVINMYFVFAFLIFSICSWIKCQYYWRGHAWCVRSRSISLSLFHLPWFFTWNNWFYMVLLHVRCLTYASP